MVLEFEKFYHCVSLELRMTNNFRDNETNQTKVLLCVSFVAMRIGQYKEEGKHSNIKTSFVCEGE